MRKAWRKQRKKEGKERGKKGAYHWHILEPHFHHSCLLIQSWSEQVSHLFFTSTSNALLFWFPFPSVSLHLSSVLWGILLGNASLITSFHSCEIAIILSSSTKSSWYRSIWYTWLSISYHTHGISLSFPVSLSTCYFKLSWIMNLLFLRLPTPSLPFFAWPLLLTYQLFKAHSKWPFLLTFKSCQDEFFPAFAYSSRLDLHLFNSVPCS